MKYETIGCNEFADMDITQMTHIKERKISMSFIDARQADPLATGLKDGEVHENVLPGHVDWKACYLCEKSRQKGPATDIPCLPLSKSAKQILFQLPCQPETIANSSQE